MFLYRGTTADHLEKTPEEQQATLLLRPCNGSSSKPWLWATHHPFLPSFAPLATLPFPPPLFFLSYHRAARGGAMTQQGTRDSTSTWKRKKVSRILFEHEQFWGFFLQKVISKFGISTYVRWFYCCRVMTESLPGHAHVAGTEEFPSPLRIFIEKNQTRCFFLHVRVYVEGGKVTQPRFVPKSPAEKKFYPSNFSTLSLSPPNTAAKVHTQASWNVEIRPGKKILGWVSCFDEKREEEGTFLWWNWIRETLNFHFSSPVFLSGLSGKLDSLQKNICFDVQKNCLLFKKVQAWLIRWYCTFSDRK